MSDDTKFTPYWWEEAPPDPVSEVDVEHDCDVVVIGGGYAGISAALTLVRAGRSVQVFDAANPGAGASSRNGGIASGNLKPSITKMIQAYGPKRATEMFAEGIAARADLAKFISDEQIDCDFSLSGRFGGACEESHYDRLEHEAELLNQTFDMECEMVTKADQQAEIGTEFYHGGIVRPDIGGLHPAKLFKGMLRLAQEAGVIVHGNTPVQGFHRDGNGYQVLSPRGGIKTRDIIVCTNGYTDKGIPWLRRRLVPVASQIIATEPLGENVMNTLMPKRRMMTETRIMGHYYRPSPDGTRILFGGRIYGTHEPDRPLPYQHLYQDMTELFPQIDGVGVSHVWWGFVAFPMDQVPQLVERDGVLYATGFSGSGVVWARWFGMKAAYRLLGEEGGECAFADRVFQAIPFYDGRPWFLPAIQAWYAFRDRYGL